jgi:hypothetical protein
MAKFMKLPFVHAKHAFTSQQFPNAPQDPTDGQKYIDPKTERSYTWNDAEKLWMDDSTMGGGATEDRRDEHE